MSYLELKCCLLVTQPGTARLYDNNQTSDHNRHGTCIPFASREETLFHMFEHVSRRLFLQASSDTFQSTTKSKSKWSRRITIAGSATKPLRTSASRRCTSYPAKSPSAPRRGCSIRDMAALFTHTVPARTKNTVTSKDSHHLLRSNQKHHLRPS